MPRRSSGRPRVISPLVEKSIILAFMNDLNTYQACAYAGIHRSTYYRHIEQNEEFAERVARAKNSTIMRAKKAIVDAVGTDPKVAKWYLSRKDPEFGPPTRRRR